VGRCWFFDNVRAWDLNTDPQAPQDLLITAGYGVSKFACLAELIDNFRERLGHTLAIAAHQFSIHVSNASLAPGEFAASVAAQLAVVLPAYRAVIEAGDIERRRTRLNQANKEPSTACDQVVVALLARIASPEDRMLLLVDALDEAL